MANDQKPPGLFDVIDDLSSAKKGILADVSDTVFKKSYNSFMVNRAFSLFPDSIMFAALMNQMHQLNPRMQHDFYFHGVGSRRRRTRWPKSMKESEDVQLVARYYQVSQREASQYIEILLPSDIESIRRQLSEGGKG